MTQISFPGLFGDKIFTINPTAVTILGRDIRWYGIIICIGIILAVMNTIRCAKKEGISTDDVLDYALWVVPCGIIGARAYYVLTSLSDYKSFSEAIAIWNGGLAIYGGIIGGTVAVLIVSAFKKIKFLKMADSIATSLLIGQFIGRWGNFCNGEAYGNLEGIDLLGKFIATPGLKENYLLRMTVNSEASYGPETVHPTFLYESLWNVIGFLLITFFIYRIKKFDGQIILAYLTWYGFGRFFIEGLRSDSLYIGNTGIRISQLLALLTFVFGVVMTAVMLVKAKKARLDGGEYVSQFGIPENAIGVIPSASKKEDSEEEAKEACEEEKEEKTEESETSSEEADKSSDETAVMTEENTTTSEEKENGNNN